MLLLYYMFYFVYEWVYSDGSINYNGEKLTVEGTVNSSADRDAISTLLANSPIASTNNTKVHFVPTETMKFKVEKKGSLVALQGEFLQQSDAQTLINALETDNVRTQIKINKSLIPDAGVIHLTEKLTHLLKMNYLSGSITYDNQKISVEGTTQSQKVKDEMEALLKTSSIPYENHTQLVVLNPKKEEQSSKVTEEAKAVEIEIKKILTLENINFELNKAALTQKSSDTLNHIAKVLKAHPALHVEIAGHTDSDGDDAYNLTLSQNRVNSVKVKLMEMEIEAARLKAIGYGETKPLVSNDTKENKRLNRRVEFIIIGE
jgi:outer membrane protein OmpA-like peptidoglycan-associated protein